MSTGPVDDDVVDDGTNPDLDDLGELGDEDQDDEEDDDNGSSGASAYKAPTAEEWAKVQRKLKRQEDRITRLTGKTPKGKSVDQKILDQLGQGDDAEDDGDEDKGEAARWRNIAIQNAASAQIAAAGFSGTAKQAARLARLIDTTGITPNRDGSFDLEDEVDELVEEYPQLFAKAQGGRGPAPRVVRRDQRSTPKADPNKSTSQAMLKAAGYR